MCLLWNLSGKCCLCGASRSCSWISLWLPLPEAQGFILLAFSLLFYLLTILTARLVSGCSSVFLLGNVKQQKHFMCWSSFSGRDKTRLQPGMLLQLGAQHPDVVTVSTSLSDVVHTMATWEWLWCSDLPFRERTVSHNSQTRTLLQDECYTSGLPDASWVWAKLLNEP